MLDLETTGLGPDAEICDIAIVGIDGRVLLDSLVCPLRTIPPEATAVHGISERDVHRAPLFSEIHPKIVQALQGRRTCVYNASYDHDVLNQLCDAHKLPGWPEPWECALLAYAEFAGERNRFGTFRWFRLSEAAARLGIAVPNAHRALADCLTTVAVVKAMAAAAVPKVERPEQARLTFGVDTNLAPWADVPDRFGR